MKNLVVMFRILITVINHFEAKMTMTAHYTFHQWVIDIDGSSQFLLLLQKAALFASYL